MARIPLVTEFEGKGLDRAIKEFKKLEGAGAKAGHLLKSAFVPATAALAGLTAAAGLSVKAAIEDTAQQAELARTLKATTDATEAQVAAVESYIAETEKAVAVSDAELRPAFANLVRATGDVTQAQELMTLALDIAAATGKDLEGVTQALQEGFQGEVGPLKELDKSLTDMIASGASADEVMAQLAETFGGAAQESTETLEGRFKLMKIELDNAKEAIGMALLPVLEELVPILESAADFVANNTDLLLGLGIAVGSVATAIVVLNGAMKVFQILEGIQIVLLKVLQKEFTLMWIATGVGIIIAIIAVIVVLQMKFNILGHAVNALKYVFSLWWDYIKWVINKAIDAINLLIKALNLIPGVDIPQLDHLGKSADEAAERIDHLANKSLRALDYEAEKLAKDSLPKLMKGIHGVRLEGGELRSTLGRVNVELDPLNEGIETATSRLDAFFKTLDQQEAADEFIENLQDIEMRLKGIQEGTKEWQEAQNEAYEALRDLRKERDDLSDAFFEVLKLEIDTGDLERAYTLMANLVNLGGIIEVPSTFADLPGLGIDAPVFGDIEGLGTSTTTGGTYVNNIYYPAGTTSDDILNALERYNNQRGTANFDSVGAGNIGP
jgi:archaellum component FlaC